MPVGDLADELNCIGPDTGIAGGGADVWYAPGIGGTGGMGVMCTAAGIGGYMLGTLAE